MVVSSLSNAEIASRPNTTTIAGSGSLIGPRFVVGSLSGCFSTILGRSRLQLVFHVGIAMRFEAETPTVGRKHTRHGSCSYVSASIEVA